MTRTPYQVNNEINGRLANKPAWQAGIGKAQHGNNVIVPSRSLRRFEKKIAKKLQRQQARGVHK